MYFTGIDMGSTCTKLIALDEGGVREGVRGVGGEVSGQAVGVEALDHDRLAVPGGRQVDRRGGDLDLDEPSGRRGLGGEGGLRERGRGIAGGRDAAAHAKWAAGLVGDAPT